MSGNFSHNEHKSWLRPKYRFFPPYHLINLFYFFYFWIIKSLRRPKVVCFVKNRNHFIIKGETQPNVTFDWNQNCWLNPKAFIPLNDKLFQLCDQTHHPADCVFVGQCNTTFLSDAKTGQLISHTLWPPPFQPISMLQLLKVHAYMEKPSSRPSCCDSGEYWKGSRTEWSRAE